MMPNHGIRTTCSTPPINSETALMKPFLARIGLFSGCLGLIVLGSSVLPNPSLVEGDLLGALPEKMATIAEMPSPKILLVGGSNISFGMDTEKLSNHFDCPAFNTGLHAGLGLRFMMLSCLPSIHEGDLVVLIPEYSQFQDSYGGSRELVATVSDVYPEGRGTLSLRQKVGLFPEFVSYSLSKLCQRLRLVQKPLTPAVYARDSFNRFGDAVSHWGLPSTAITDAPIVCPNPRLNRTAIQGVVEFRRTVETRGATLVILPPCFLSSSYENQRHLIEAVDEALSKNGIGFDARCERYSFDREYFFNTPYHLTKEGVDSRTRLVIEDIESLEWR